MRRAWSILAFTMVLPLGSTLAVAGMVAPPRADGFEPRLVRVAIDAALPLDTLLAHGVDVVALKGGSATVVEWPGTAATLAALGAHAEVLDAHPGATAAARAKGELDARPRPTPARVRSAVGPDGAFRIESLPPFGSGSMGGYWTLTEVKTKLDSLVAADVNDVVEDKLDTLGTTVQGRPIWGLKLGRHVDGPDTRPVAYYNALTHAREPEGMQSLFWFVDDLLAGYGVDPFATYLLDHRVIYVCPVVNPDGYVRNQTTNPGGGGFWRKNLRDNNHNGVADTYGGGGDGVDLNRNFGYKWGFDNVGSVPDSSSDIYRGPSAFSEPETQAQRDVVSLLQPKTGLSFHTYSDLFLHPWGYTPAAAPDSAKFYEWNDEATVNSGFATGPGPRVLYTVNGEFNDWAYGDTLAKPRAFTWTPEVGNDVDGFWPAPSRILPIAQDQLRKCWFVAAIAGPYVRVESSSIAEGALNAGNLAHLAVRARNLGIGASDPVTAALFPLDAGVNVEPTIGTVDYPALGSRQSADALAGATFTLSASDTLTPGRLVRFRIEFTASGYYSRDTVEVVVGTPTTLFADASNDFTQWVNSLNWGVVSNDPRHPDHYFADSPAGLYPSSMDRRAIVRGRLDLSAGVHAYALFDARWNFEQNYDGATLEASFDSVTWKPMTGRASHPAAGVPGTTQPPAGQPVYAGARWLWKPERVDLSAMTGTAGDSVRLRFRSRSDGGLNADGFNFDSMRVVVYDPAAQPAPTLAAGGGPAPARLAFALPAPTPARDRVTLDFTLPRAGALRLDVFDLLGRRVRTLAAGPRNAGRYVLAWDLRDDAGRTLAPGVYVARLDGAEGARTRRIVILH